LLAHGHRDKSGSPAWAWDVFDVHDCPTAYAETILLGNCAVIAVDITINRHQTEYRQAGLRLMNERKNIQDKGIRTTEEIEKELNVIKAEIARISKTL